MATRVEWSWKLSSIMIINWIGCGGIAIRAFIYSAYTMLLFSLSPLKLLMVTMVIRPFSWLFWYKFSNCSTFVSIFDDICFCCFINEFWASFLCTRLIPFDEFLPTSKSSWFLWLIRRPLLGWQCWLWSVIVGMDCETVWMDVWTADSGDDNCVIELLLLLMLW